MNLKIDPALYILMRSDMDSLNPGKAMAQAAHAANQFVYVARDILDNDPDDDEKETKALREALEEWENEGGGFGTTIVLDVGCIDNLNRIVEEEMDNHPEVQYGIVHDSSYPVRDGSVTHLIPVDTCAYVFVPDRSAEDALRLDLPLYK